MTPDPYDHVREAFHTVADGLMGWEDPQDGQPDTDENGPEWLPTDHPDYSEEERQEWERCQEREWERCQEGEPCQHPEKCIPLGGCRYGAERRSNGIGAYYRSEDVDTLERAGESLMRLQDETNAIRLFALALRIRQAVRDD